MLKSTKNNYGVASMDNWNGKMMWRTLEKCWRCQGFCGDGEEGKSKVSPRNHYQGRHWNYTKEEWNKRTQGLNEKLKIKLNVVYKTLEQTCETHNNDWKVMVTKEWGLWKEFQVVKVKLQKTSTFKIIHITIDWEKIVTKNQAKATLYDQFVG